jgi:hypothetical protein
MDCNITLLSPKNSYKTSLAVSAKIPYYNYLFFLKIRGSLTFLAHPSYIVKELLRR